MTGQITTAWRKVPTFPLTPALSLGERVKIIDTHQQGVEPRSASCGVRHPLSLGERAGVRGKDAPTADIASEFMATL
jgi:hypothetical protein